VGGWVYIYIYRIGVCLVDREKNFFVERDELLQKQKNNEKQYKDEINSLEIRVTNQSFGWILNNENDYNYLKSTMGSVKMRLVMIFMTIFMIQRLTLSALMMTTMMMMMMMLMMMMMVMVMVMTTANTMTKMMNDDENVMPVLKVGYLPSTSKNLLP